MFLHLVRFLPKAAIAIPVGVMFLFLSRYAVDLPLTDQWEVVNLLHVWVRGDARAIVSALLAQHNEYRPVVARLFFLALFPLTSWDTRAEMWLSALVSVGIFALIFALIRRAGIKGAAPQIVTSFICFSLGQFENILWGWQLAVYLQVFFGLIALYGLSSESIQGTVIAGFSALVSMFCYQLGIAVWAAGWTYLLLRRRALPHVLIWSAFMVLSLALQYGSYRLNFENRTLIPSDITRVIVFFLLNVGAPLGVLNEPLSGMMGLVLLFTLLASILTIRRNEAGLPFSRQLALALSLVAISFVSSTLITLGRSQFGLDWAVQSRYTTVTSVGVLGIFMCLHLAHTCYSSRFTSTLVMLSSVAIVVGVGFSYVQGISSGMYSWATRMMLRFTVQSMDFEFVDHRVIFHDLEVLQRRLAFLKKYRLGVYREPPLILIPKQVNAKPAPIISPSSSLVQTFRCPVKSLYDFKLPFATSGHKSTGTLQLVLRNGEETVISQAIPMEKIQPNSWVTFSLPRPIDQCYGQELTLELSTRDATAENMVTLWTFPANYEVIRSQSSPGIQGNYAIGLKLNYDYYRLPF